MREHLDALVSTADNAMIIVTASTGHEHGGCLVGFHSQASIDPWRYTVHLSKKNHTYRVALEATHLLVHFLDERMHDLAEIFGTLTDDGARRDKFGLAAWEPGPDGRTPRLLDIPNWFIGRVLTHVDHGGDHVAFVLEPEEASSVDEPLPPLRLREVRHLEAGHPA